MKTLFAFMTGILGGIMIGGALTRNTLITDEYYREYMNNLAESMEKTKKGESQ